MQLVDDATVSNHGETFSGYLFASVATESERRGVFGANLKRLRKRGGFATARELAKDLKIVPSVLSKLEQGKQGLPEGATLLRLAKTITCSVDELLEGVDDDYDAILLRLGRTTSEPGDLEERADALVADLLMGENARRVMEAATRLPDEKLLAVAMTTELLAELQEAAERAPRRGAHKSTPDDAGAPESHPATGSRRAGGRRRHS